MDQRSKIAILGFGVEGRALLAYLIANGYNNITVCDHNVDLEDEMPDGVSVRLGEHYLHDLSDFEVAFRSPGIPYFRPEIQAAMVAGTNISSSTEYFLNQCPCPVVGVTGTKGKGTTCSLIFQMLLKSGKKEDEEVFLGGNIGRSPMEFYDKLKGSDLVILELSSFQLQNLKKSPKYAVLLNTTSDHLDYHADVDEYLEAKEGILDHQNESDMAVLNKDYEYVKYYQPLVKGDLKWVSAKEVVKDGAYVKDGVIYHAKGGKSDRVADVSEMKLIGSHNIENVLPAVAVARKLGVSLEDIAEVIRTFENLPHRLQFVREVGGVSFYNDSYSTNTQTSMAAVDSFEEPTVLIAGGSDKELDFNEWALKILTKPNLHVVVLIGETAEKMEEALIEAEGKLGDAEGSPTKILRRGTLEEAVLDAYAESDQGGVVVMSPAATSFDMFENYKQRGNDFIAHARKLK